MTWFHKATRGRVSHLGRGDSGGSRGQAELQQFCLWDSCSRPPVFTASSAAAPTPVGGP